MKHSNSRELVRFVRPDLKEPTHSDWSFHVENVNKSDRHTASET